MAGLVGAAPARRPWPALREELALVEGPRTRFGAPTWTLHDLSSHRFFRLGWLELEILQRWTLGDAEAIAAAIARDTPLAPAPAAVEATLAFAIANHWTVAADPEATGRLARERRRRRTSLPLWLAKNYLFLRIPLVHPDRFLAATLPAARWLFSRAAACALVAALAAFYLIGRQWTQFRDTFAVMFTLEGGLTTLAALGLSKAVHELGHAYAARHFGLRVPAMGVALMCFMPVLWTDTSEAWKLPRRRDRLLIGVAGVASELALATLAAWLWLILPPGGLKTGAFLLTSSAWIVTLAININPFMRYDGYYLLSDYWNVPGLQTCSFALAKWWLREQLFGYGRPPPSAYPPAERAKLVVFAFATWLYRFFLFLGIAILVYHFFFKALGLVLMVVELAFFIARPVAAEFWHWVKHIGELTMNRRLLRTALLAAILAALFAWPWHTGVGGGAILLAQRQTVLYATRGAVIETLEAANGQTVAEGDVLLTLRSPDLDAQIGLTRIKIAQVREKMAIASLERELRVEMEQSWGEMESLAGDLAGLLKERETLALRAPFAGTVTGLPSWARPGAWVMAREGLAAVVGPTREVQAFVGEGDWARLSGPGIEGKFYAAGARFAPMPVRVAAVERQATTELPFPELASVLGGPVGAHRADNGRLVPDRALYRVICTVDGGESPLALVGQATFTGEPRSLMRTAWRNFVGLLVRESTL